MMTNSSVKKLKMSNFQPEWENEYFFTEINKMCVCLLCNATLTIDKEWSVERHFKSLHSWIDNDFPLNSDIRRETVKQLKAAQFMDQRSFPLKSVDNSKGRTNRRREEVKQSKVQIRDQQSLFFKTVDKNKSATKASSRVPEKLVKTGFRNMCSESVKGVKLKTLTDFLELFAPKSLAESWDNTGLLVEPITAKSVNSILLTNDLTEDVVQEALDVKAGLIISYHPPIFKPLTRITTESWKERIISTCLENRIAVYSPHTSWDSVSGGVNDWLASAFDTEKMCAIIQKSSFDQENTGPGRFCELKNPIKISEAVERVKKLTSLKYLNLALARGASLDSKISNLGICAGSGSSVLTGVTADLFLTGEMSHHDLLHATHCGTSVILCNHSNTERGFLREFAKIMESEFHSFGVQIFVSNKDRDPIQIV